MKKYLTILLAALLLVCAVSCSSSPKEKTGIQLDTSAVKGLGNDGTITKIQLEGYPSTKERDRSVLSTIDIKDIKSGSVFVELAAGTYEEVVLNIPPYEPFEVKTGTKDTLGDTIVVKKGEVTECYVASHPM